MNKAIVLAAALVITPLPALCQNAQTAAGGGTSYSTTPGGGGSFNATEEEGGINTAEANQRSEMGDLLDRLSQSQLKDQLESAIQRVEDACANDIDEFCGSVTPGGGRIALCMRAHSDLLSRRCRFTLLRTARNIRQNVASIADECINGLRNKCKNAGNVGQCAEQQSASISPACHTVVATIQQVGQKMTEAGQRLTGAGQQMAGAGDQGGAQQMAAMQGMPVFSSDDQNIGRVVDVTRGPDGRIQSVAVQVGRFLGIGDRVVTINADTLRQAGDRIQLKMDANQVRSLPGRQG